MGWTDRIMYMNKDNLRIESKNYISIENMKTKYRPISCNFILEIKKINNQR